MTINSNIRLSLLESTFLLPKLSLLVFDPGLSLLPVQLSQGAEVDVWKTLVISWGDLLCQEILLQNH